jgi:hypothetical protein
MADYPDAIFEARETENLPGLSRSIATGNKLKQNFFSEDYQDLGAEITAIENALGIGFDISKLNNVGSKLFLFNYY